MTEPMLAGRADVGIIFRVQADLNVVDTLDGFFQRAAQFEPRPRIDLRVLAAGLVHPDANARCKR